MALPWLMMGASALMGQQAARAKSKAQDRQNMAAAEQTEWSPWTGMDPGQIDTTPHSQTAGALQGGLTGFMQGKNIEAGMDGGASVKATPENVGNAYGKTDYNFNTGTMGQEQNPSMFGLDQQMQKKTLYR